MILIEIVIVQICDPIIVFWLVEVFDAPPPHHLIELHWFIVLMIRQSQTCYIKMGTCHAPQGNESIRIHLLSNTFLWNLNLRKLNKKFKIKKKIGSIYISRAKSNTLLDTTCFMMNCLSECLVLYQISSTIIQLFRITILSKFKKTDTWMGGSIFKRRIFSHMTV